MWLGVFSGFLRTHLVGYFEQNFLFLRSVCFELKYFF